MKKMIAKAQEDSMVFGLLLAVAFLLGAVVGFMIAPIKKGTSVTIGSNNIIYGSDDDDDEADGEEE